jgi:hypothetical protein
MTGRPSLRTPEIIEEIIERISAGEPMAWICRDTHMPAVRTVTAWMDSDADLSAAIARARELGGDAIATDALEIADKTDEDPASRRVRVETRLKLLAKWHPKRYGDRVALTGEDGGAIKHQHTLAVERLSNHALREIAALSPPSEDEA